MAEEKLETKDLDEEVDEAEEDFQEDEEEIEDKIAQAEQKEAEVKRAGALFSPEGVIMMTTAIFIDVGEFFVELIPIVGQIISICIDIFAVFFIGGWMLFRSGTVKITTKAAARVGKAAQWARRLKWLRPLFFIIELLPIASSVLPLWILIVYLELKYNS